MQAMRYQAYAFRPTGGGGSRRTTAAMTAVQAENPTILVGHFLCALSGGMVGIIIGYLAS